jgi:glycosyltransferase involved in cell wall biosynthesis
MEKKTKIGFLLSHPIQYFSPLLQALAKEKDIDLKVYYCSDYGIAQKVDKEFGRVVTWDIPLLEGYEYEFIKNNSINPSVTNFWGLVNFDIIKKLKQDELDIFMVHGWGYFTHWLAIVIASFLGIKVWLRGETPLKQVLLQSKKKKYIRKLLFKDILFRFVHKFLYIGTENKKFYNYLGVKDEDLVFTPYCIDNQRFNKEYEAIKNKKTNLRENLGIETKQTVFLFCGKFIDKKQPLLLLEAYKNIQSDTKVLILIGDGYLKPSINEYISLHNLKNIYVVGFKNQSELAQYYIMADIFVLPSTVGETWGLVVNEAMNFKLPLLLSSMVGCADDLVEIGKNGYTFENENVNDLKDKMENMLQNTDILTQAGQKSKDIIQNYSIETIVKNIKQAIQNYY